MKLLFLERINPEIVYDSEIIYNSQMTRYFPSKDVGRSSFFDETDTLVGFDSRRSSADRYYGGLISRPGRFIVVVINLFRMASAPSVIMPDLLDSVVRRNDGGVFLYQPSINSV